MLDGLVAGRASFWGRVRHLLSTASRLDRADHIGDHIPSPFDPYPVVNANILFSNKIKIMQSSLFDNHATDFDRFQDGIGCQHTGAPHIDADIVELGGDLLGRKFKSNCAARVFPDHDQISEKLLIVDLDYRAINLIIQTSAPLTPRTNGCNDFIQIVTMYTLRDGES